MGLEARSLCEGSGVVAGEEIGSIPTVWLKGVVGCKKGGLKIVRQEIPDHPVAWVESENARPPVEGMGALRAAGPQRVEFSPSLVLSGEEVPEGVLGGVDDVLDIGLVLLTEC